MSDEALRLYKARKTVCQMLRDRKFNVTTEDLEMTYDQFKKKFANVGGNPNNAEQIKREDLSFTSRHVRDPNNVILVWFEAQTEKKIGTDNIKAVQ